MGKKPLSQKQQAIVEAAAAQFARFGYAKTTLDDVGRACRMNKATIYYYFSGKEALYRQVLLQEMEQLFGSADEVLTGIKQARKRIVRYLEHRHRSLGQMQGLGCLDNTLELHGGETLKELNKTFRQRDLEILKREIASGIEREAWKVKRTDLLAEALLDASDGIRLHSASRTGAEVDTDNDLNKVSYLVNLTLKGLPVRSGS